MGRLAERNKRTKLTRRLRVPVVHELRYQRALTGAMGTLHRKALDWLRPRLDQVAKKTDSARSDASKLTGEWDDEVDALIVPLAASVSPAFDVLAKDVAKNNARTLRGLGLDVRDDLGPVVDHLRAWNVSLIKKAADDFRDQVKGVLEDPASWGLRVEELAAKLQERADVSSSRATLIARDQTSKMNGAINQHRQTHAGITSYTWSTSRDERVRETHASKEGLTFSWNAPPADTGAPGEDIQCRCVALPILPGEGDDEDQGAAPPADPAGE